MEDSTTVGQRFLQFISHLGISKNAFAASLDKTATVIQHLVDERNKPGFDLLCKVFEVYPNVSKDWLLQGVGPMLADSVSVPQPAAVAPVIQELNAVAATIEEVPIIAPKAETPALETPSKSTGSVLPVADLPIAQPMPSVPAVPPVQTALPPSAPDAGVPTATPALADTSWQTALYTQQMAHQLALAELRNQHLQDQQRLMQQMLDLMQRQLPR